MASKLEKQKLIADLDRSRLVLKQDFRSTLDRLNFRARAESAVANSPIQWMVGAATTGMILGGLFRGSRKSRIQARFAKSFEQQAAPPAPVPTPAVLPTPAIPLFSGVFAELLKFTFLAAKPLLLAYATSKAADLAAQLKVRDKQRRKK